MPRRTDIDARIDAIARANDDVVHTRQLRANGVGPGHVHVRRLNGRLAVIIGGSFGVGPRAADPTTPMLRRAALLHMGPSAMLCGPTAARHLADWDRDRDPSIHVVSPTGSKLADPRFAFHRSVICASIDHRGLPVLEPTLLALDLATRHDPWQLANLICELRYRRMLTVDRLEATIEAHAHAPGMVPLRHAVGLVRAGSVGTRGRTEDALRLLVEAAGVGEVLVNQRGAMGLPNDEPDFAIVGALLNVECDGGHHLEPEREVQDQARDDVAGARRWRVLRIWWEDVWNRPERVIATMRSAVADPRSAIEYNADRWAGGRHRLA
jgi:very-short-patch-repair endonuclease